MCVVCVVVVVGSWLVREIQRERGRDRVRREIVCVVYVCVFLFVCVSSSLCVYVCVGGAVPGRPE